VMHRDKYFPKELKGKAAEMDADTFELNSIDPESV